MTYRAYVIVYDETTGKQKGKKALEPIARNINAHVTETARLNGWAVRPAWWTATHLGHPVLRMDAGSAGEARANFREAQRFLSLAGWKTRWEWTAATERAL